MPQPLTDLSLSARICKSGTVLSRVLDDEVLLLDLDSEHYFGLGGVGSRIWELLDETSDLGSIHARLVAEFEVAPETVERDLLTLVNALRERKLVQLAMP